MTDLEVRAELSELHVVALTMWGEARGDTAEGGSSVEERIAVGCVIRNRMVAKQSTYRAICLAPKQFSCWWPAGGAENYQAVMALAKRLIGEDPALGPEDPIFTECRFLAGGIINRRLLDRVKGSTHYLTADLLQKEPPAWAKGQEPTCRVGSQVFFAGIP